jgi:hypothetical protein
MKDNTLTKQEKELNNKYAAWFEIGEVLRNRNLDLVLIEEDGQTAMELVSTK